MAVVEITGEPVLEHWKRSGSLKPNANKKIHTMKAVVGTSVLNFGAANITMYAYVRIRDLFEYQPEDRDVHHS